MEVGKAETSSGGPDLAAAIISRLGRGVAWLTLVMVVLIFSIVVFTVLLSIVAHGMSAVPATRW